LVLKLALTRNVSKIELATSYNIQVLLQKFLGTVVPIK